MHLPLYTFGFSYTLSVSDLQQVGVVNRPNTNQQEDWVLALHDGPSYVT